MTRRRPTAATGREFGSCKQCHGAVAWAQAPWGTVALEPYPDPDGELYVDVLKAGLLVLGKREKHSSVTKRWQRHTCPVRGVPRPKPQPEQLGLF